MIEYLAQNEGPVTHQLIFKDTGISEKNYKQLENRIRKYRESLVLTHVPRDEVIIIVNKKFNNPILSEIKTLKKERVKRETHFGLG